MIKDLIALILSETQAQIDDKALDEFVDYLSIDTEQTIIFLQRKNLTWATKTPVPSKESLDKTADWIILRAIRKATFRGALGGSVGIISILPEQLVSWSQLLHLVQRLAIIYGIDMQTSLGQTYLIHAFAYMYDIPIPKQHATSLKVSELVKTFQQSTPNTNAALQFLLKQIVRQSLKRQGRKMIPGLGIFIGAYDAHYEMNIMAQRCKAFLSKRHRINPSFDDIEEAIEISSVNQ